MVQSARLSWKTKSKTGNRQGTLPARMVGLRLCSDRSKRTEAKRVLADVAKWTGDRAHGWALSLLFIMFGTFLLTVVARADFKKSVLEQEKDNQRILLEEQMKAAVGMESILVDQMIRSMRKSLPGDDIFERNQGEKIFRQMLDTEYSQIISNGSSLGVAELVLEEIQGKR